jgi:hypothetical protein
MTRRFLCGSFAALCLLGAAACADEPDFAGGDSESIVSRERGEPMTVAGCLRAGAGTNTFVLTTERAEGQAESATYNLTGAQTASLREHVGQQVQVTGTLVQDTQVVRESATAPQEAKGTTGTPTVETRTELDVKRMEVSSVTSMGRKCDAN